ncbi:MAG TPA: class I SAM-dependent methyltransferase [Planctomycetota bacterium]|nr:class I SAM-dependent methyltransferase [Planctomycetota bacterium]
MTAARTPGSTAAGAVGAAAALAAPGSKAAALAGAARVGFAAALAALPAPLNLLPFHAASQLVHLLPSDPAQRRPWRILEVLDAPGDPPLFARVGEALDVAAQVAIDRPAILAADATAGAAGTFNLIYVHAGCDTRAEFRALMAALELRMAPDGLLWIQALDPIFAPAALPPAGRTFPALSGLLSELQPARWRWALRCQRAIFAPELLIHRATAEAAARWSRALGQFARGFPYQPFEPAQWCGLPGPAPSAAGATMLDLIHRDGLELPRRDENGRNFRPAVTTAAPRFIVTGKFPDVATPKNTAAATAAWTGLRVTVDINADTGPLTLDWLGAAAWRCAEQEPSPKDLPPGRQVQVWTVAKAAETRLVHAVLHAPRLQRLYGLQIELLPKAPALDPARLPRDMFARHRAVAALFSANEAARTMLDIGGAPGLLAALLPQHAVTTVDTGHAVEHAGFLRLSALGLSGEPASFQLPFADASFDAVVAIDVLEHIPAERRAAFIAEAARVAKATLVIAGPVDSAAARGAEAALAAALNAAQSESATGAAAGVHEFLDEHRRFGLPAAADIERWFAAAGRPVMTSTAGATVADWLADTAADLGLEPSAVQALPADATAIIYRLQLVWTAASRQSVF